MRIICCGNPYRADDAAGLLVAERLHQLGIEVSTCTGEATDLLQAMNGAEEVLIVDAMTSGAPLGTIHECHDGITEFQHNAPTTHALGVAQGIALAGVLGRLPARLHMYSIEARTFEVGWRGFSRTQASCRSARTTHCGSVFRAFAGICFWTLISALE